ncbi:hypothetical protein Q8A67_023123 [Cirrhinus molitorella]|uniref:Uncharacterized protein n=1 Tax=Cirrhinus molitorella TaxID=172907 RepID=A0AA88NZF0_9TELE|nr:hypothetical protein Q8A67_023123 [Cirrhinus molitorella]
MASVEQDCDTQDEPGKKKLKLEEGQMSSSGVGVHMNAQTGGTANAPAFINSTITSLTIKYSTAETQKLPETAEEQTEKQDLILKEFLETHKSNMKKKAESLQISRLVLE